jgi:hypothetical protein
VSAADPNADATSSGAGKRYTESTLMPIPLADYAKWPGLSPSEQRMGTVVFAMVRDWHSWCHRRVETIELRDPYRFQRRVSVDFTVPQIPPPIKGAAGQAIFPIPLTLLIKERLRQFSLRDEADHALPLMTRAKNAAVGAGALQTAAEVLVDPESKLGAPPKALVYDFVRIAISGQGRARDLLVDLAQPGENDAGPDAQAIAAWRKALILNEDFMALASDLARNFLVIVPLEAAEDDRRILKFSFEDDHPPAPRLTSQEEDPRPDAASGRALLRIKVETQTLDDQGQPIATAPTDCDVIVRDGTGRERRRRTGPDGSSLLQVRVGSGEVRVRVDVPPGRLAAGPRVQRFGLKPGDEQAVEFLLAIPQHGALQPEPVAAEETPASRRVRGFYPVFLNTPSLGKALSYHIEVAAPQGLIITTASLHAGRPEDVGASGIVPSDAEMITRSRAHLHLSASDQSETGVAWLTLRPAPATILRAARINALLAVALLVIAVIWNGRIGANVGAVGALLLLIPGGASAYIVRPREHPIATAMLLGVRALALLAPLMTAAGALTLTLGRKWSLEKTGLVAGKQAVLVPIALIVYAVVAFVSFLIIEATLRRVKNPPEQVGDEPRTVRLVLGR